MELTFRRFYVLVQPDKDTVDMPWYFFDRFKDELQRRVWLIDSRGSMFGVFIQKTSDGGGAYFYHLVSRLIEHYDQPLGLILRLKYIGDSIFQMSVRNLDLVKIRSRSVQTFDHPDYITAEEMRDMYEAPVQHSNDGVDVGARATEPTVVEVKDTSSDCNGLQDDCLAAGSFDMDDKSDDVENVDNFDDVVAVENLVSSIVIISQYQISSNKLYLPTKLVRDGLIREKPTSVTLVDSDNNEFQCKLRWKHWRNQVKAYLSGGWMEFCRDNQFSAGTRVRLAVNPTNPKVIYAREALLGED